MNRREFFRRTVPAVAVTVAAASQPKWTLGCFKRLLARVLRGVQQAPQATVASLAELYRKTNTSVLAALRSITEEAKWFRQFPTERIVVGAGNEVRLPLHVWGRG